MRNLISRALRSPWARNYARRLYADLRTEQAHSVEPEVAIPELTPLNARYSSLDKPRLNLLVPALSLNYVFGGITTALTFFEYMGAHYSNLRIILTDQASFHHQDNPSFPDWDIISLEDSDAMGKKIVPAGDRRGKTLPVSKGDRFLTTSWWSAVLAKQLQRQQQELLDEVEPQKYIYLIQDYEPGFYPWSARYAMAEASYHDAEGYVAIFNTSILMNYFKEEGYKHHFSRSFEPTLHTSLQSKLNWAKSIPKERRVLVYGRPTVERNVFPIIVMSLRQWIADNSPEGWIFCSAGEEHPPIDLGRGNQLISLGKLSIDNYAEELARTFLGISLMISPHPSYPPLEMAAFGIKTITNRYKSKDLSHLNPYIHSIDFASPELIAQKLQELSHSFSETHQPLQSKGSNQGKAQFLDFCDGKSDIKDVAAWAVDQI